VSICAAFDRVAVMHFARAERILRLTAIAAVVLPAGYFGIFAWSSYRSQEEVVRDQLQLSAQIVREHAAKVFETQELLVEHIDLLLKDRSDEDIRADEAAINRYMRALVDRLDQVLDVGILNSSARTLVSANLFPTPYDQQVYADRPHFRAFAERQVALDRTYIGPLLRGRIQNTLSFYFARARTTGPDGRFAGVIAVGVDPDHFRRFYSTVAHGSVSSVGLFRADGSLLARFPETAVPESWRAESLVRAIAVQPARGVYETVASLDGERRIIAYERLVDYPVYVAASIDLASVRDEWLHQFLAHMIFAVPATLALCVLTLFAIRYVRSGHATLTDLRAEVARREATEMQLRQAQKMEAVGRLTGGVAHDFNNLLTIVLGNLDRARRFLTSPAQLQTSLDRATEGAVRAARLTQRLLAFSRQQPLQPESLDVNRLVAGMSDLMHRTLGGVVRVETALASGLWRASADPNQLENAILNLAVNGRDAMGEGGTLTIATANASVNAKLAQANGAAPGDYVAVSVTDTGAGMTPEVMARAFEPFFTTKPTDKGTGLGLSQVYGFASQSGGFVAIDSTPGRGTTVTIYLPRDTAPAPAAEAADAPAAPRRAESLGATVLVVEDDALVRRLAVETLEDADFDVVAAATSERAQASIDALPDIALLLTDVVLGGAMTGVQLAQAAQQRRPGLRVLFMTGYAAEQVLAGRPEPQRDDVVHKPFSGPDLVARVRHALAG
jgi:signal transduction histidine kinase